MKKTELFDKHSDRRKAPKKKKFNGDEDFRSKREERISFKNYIRELEESMIDDYDDLDN